MAQILDQEVVSNHLWSPEDTSAIWNFHGQMHDSNDAASFSILSDSGATVNGMMNGTSMLMFPMESVDAGTADISQQGIVCYEMEQMVPNSNSSDIAF